MAATIEDQLNSFQKHLWSHEKPMDFATDVVRELLLEIQRQRTVMKASHDEIATHVEVHQKHWAQAGNGQESFNNLMNSLTGKRNGFYAQFLSQEEYAEFIRRQSSFDVFEQFADMEGE